MFSILVNALFDLPTSNGDPIGYLKKESFEFSSKFLVALNQKKNQEQTNHEDGAEQKNNDEDYNLFDED